MSGEIQVRSSLTIRKGGLDYQSRPTSFVADMDGSAKGAVPGNVVATVNGTSVDLSGLTTPGFCRIANVGSTLITYGIWDPETARFYPLGEVYPGESYVLRLSRSLQYEYGIGTGSIGPNTNRLQVRCPTGTVNVLIEAFEK